MMAMRGGVGLGRVLWILVEPQDEAGDGHHSPIMSGELFVAGGESAEAFEVVEAAFDDVAAPVDLLVEAAATPSTPRAGGELVAAFGDRVRDPAPTQIGADLVGGIALVGDEVQRPGARPAGTPTADPDRLDDLDQARAVVDVAARDEERQRQTASVAGQVDLGGQPAPGSSERPAGLMILLPVRPGRVPFLRAPAAC
ncbi:hypothetical protein Airi01_033320 [Actinoallomurus iriomotensis]|uniref:Uncharacterized protein n=1 Tax=Actinoallomurus iriomotensis TaxID=478107 RepID=A0A9W6VNU1_9ACTN|nr:hypothetical protein Airi01_033320 [Actinoallomurus iriomotensis]